LVSRPFDGSPSQSHVPVSESQLVAASDVEPPPSSLLAASFEASLASFWGAELSEPEKLPQWTIDPADSAMDAVVTRSHETRNRTRRAYHALPAKKLPIGDEPC
jgi:hypothetical protein